MLKFFIGKSVMVLLSVKEGREAGMKAIGHHLNSIHLEWIIGSKQQEKANVNTKGDLSGVLNQHYHTKESALIEL